MMLGSIGDVASSCGPNPCGMLEGAFGGLFATSPECAAWKVCSNVQALPLGGQCIVGGLDENGNTIVSCGGQDPTESPYPVVTSAPCTGMTPEQCAAVTQAPAVGVPQWALLAGVVFALAMIAGRR